MLCFILIVFIPNAYLDSDNFSEEIARRLSVKKPLLRRHKLTRSLTAASYDAMVNRRLYTASPQNNPMRHSDVGVQDFSGEEAGIVTPPHRSRFATTVEPKRVDLRLSFGAGESS